MAVQSISLPKELKIKAAIWAAKLDISKSAFIRLAVAAYIEQLEKEKE